MRRPLLLLLCSCTYSLNPYRVVFRDVHAAFRSEDVHSAAHDLGGRVEQVSTTSARLQLPDDAAAATLAERSVLVRYILEEWGAGATLRDAASQARTPSDGPLANGASWRIRVQSPGRRTGLVNAHDPVLFKEIGGLLDALPGPVRLKDAEEDVAVLLRGEEVVVGRVVARGCAAELLSQSWSCVGLQRFRHRSIAAQVPCRGPMLQRLDDDGRDARLRHGVVRARAAWRPRSRPVLWDGRQPPRRLPHVSVCGHRRRRRRADAAARHGEL